MTISKLNLKQVCWWLLVGVLAQACNSPQDSAAVAALPTPHTLHDFDVPDGENGVSFAISLNQGEVLHLDVNQRRHDLSLLLQTQAGKMFIDHDLGTWAPETLWFFSDRDQRVKLTLNVVGRLPQGQPSQWRWRIYAADNPTATNSAKAFQTWRLLAHPTTIGLQGIELSEQTTLQGLQAAREQLETHQQLVLAGRVGIDLALQLESQQQIEQALAAASQAVRTLRKQGTAPWTLVAANTLAQIYSRNRQFPQALDAYDLAFQQASTLQWLHQMGLARNDKGLLLAQMGQAEAAVEQFHLAIAHYNRSNSTHAKAVSLLNKGQSLMQLGLYDLAKTDFQNSAQFYDAAFNDNGKADALLELGWLAKLEGNRSQARQYFQKALRLKHTANKQSGGVLDRWGSLLRDVGSFKPARRKYQQALEVFEQEDMGVNQAHTHSNLAELALLEGAFADVAEHLDQAQALFQQHQRRFELAHVWHQRARLAIAQQHTHQARQAFQKGLAVLETYRQHTRNPHFQRHFAKIYQTLSQHYVLWLASQAPTRTGRDVSDALLWLEQGRAFSLRSNMSNPAQEMNAELEEARARLEAWEGVATESLSPQARAQTQANRQQAVDAFYRLQAAAKPPSKSAELNQYTLQELQRQLGYNRAALVFVLENPHSYLWELTHQDLLLHQLPGEAALRPLITAFHRSLAQRESGDRGNQRAALAKQLSQILLKPLQYAQRKSQWLVVPHRSLNLIPLSALPDPSQPQKLLAHSVRLTYTPSLATSIDLSLREQQKAPAPKQLLAVGDARYVLEETLAVRQTQPKVAGAFQRRTITRNLPHTGEELNAIASFLPGGRREVLRGFEASKKNLKALDLSQYQVVHFATHGLHHPFHGDLSGLVLSQVTPDGEVLDGHVRVVDIQNWHLQASLVVLSACETGLGEAVAGEGVWGLGQAFMTAGAARVVVSLWPVEDAATARFMTSFYRALWQQGMSPENALGAAKQTMLAQPETRDAYFWAGFVLQGASSRDPR